MARAWADVSLDAIAANVETLRSVCAPAEVCAVVKADGYGHGAVPVAQAAVDGGAAWLAVAQVAEAAELRAAGIAAPILLLSEPPLGRRRGRHRRGRGGHRLHRAADPATGLGGPRRRARPCPST